MDKRKRGRDQKKKLLSTGRLTRSTGSPQVNMNAQRRQAGNAVCQGVGGEDKKEPLGTRTPETL